MTVTGFVKKGTYYDSVSIMLLAKRISAIPGVADSAAVMGTKENKSMLDASGLSMTEFNNAGEMDLLVAVKTSGEASSILGSVEELFKTEKQGREENELNPSGIDGAISVFPDANLAMISVAGRYAGDVAMNALQHGLHVFLFSDNVPLEMEIELKKFAHEKNLFVMGPDCGTAIVNGVPLAFANVVNRGTIGVVAASGTGLQEVTCLISNAGSGISQALGTGGRDVKKEVGGVMFLQGIEALANDDDTEVILLVSKPPADEVLAKIKESVKHIKKPVIGMFIGASPKILAGTNIGPASTLEEAALKAAALAQGKNTAAVDAQLNSRKTSLTDIARRESKKLAADQGYVRALFSGGTFCDEALRLAENCLTDVYSNIPFGPIKKLRDSWKSEKHTFIDLGDDEFTVGRPHPMIDYSTRCKRLLAEANDPHTAVILLDVVLGYGSAMNPLADLLPAIEQARKIAAGGRRHLPIVCSVTGTDHDPQNRSTVAAALQQAGVIVLESNAAASMLAISIGQRQ